jgi:hypothetical protein
MARSKRGYGSGVNPNNDLARELTRARQKANARRKTREPIEVLLQPAKYEPQQVLIEKPAAAPQKKKKPPHP